MQLWTYAEIVTQTSIGLNIALFLIPLTGTRLDNEDVIGLECV